MMPYRKNMTMRTRDSTISKPDIQSLYLLSDYRKCGRTSFIEVRHARLVSYGLLGILYIGTFAFVRIYIEIEF